MREFEKKPLISVIIPVYNVFPYLKICVESVLKQTYSELEVILVDDGSTDQSGVLCDEFAETDQRIRVLHCENQGVSVARNSGLEIMTGEYVAFVDSDDFIAEEYLQILYDRLIQDDTDMVVAGYQKFSDGKTPDMNDDSRGHWIYNQEQVKKLMLGRKLPMYTHGKLYKADLFRDIRFPIGRLYEDFIMTWEILKKIDSVSVVKKKMYFYRQREGSIVNSIFLPNRMDFIYFTEKVFDETVNDPAIHVIAGSRCFFSVADNYALEIGRYPEIEKELREKIIKYRSYVLKDEMAGMVLKVLAVISYVSPVLVKWLGKMYKRLLCICR